MMSFPRHSGNNVPWYWIRLLGAMEGILHGIPSIAISQVYTDNKHSLYKYGYDLAQEVVKEIVEKIFKNGYPFDIEERKILNINIPPVDRKNYKGMMITKAGYRLYSNEAHMHTNPRGLEYYWLGVASLKWKKRDDFVDIISDLEAVEQGYASITPIKLDMTAYKDLDRVRSDLGSTQNQMTSTINNITITQANVKIAESNIRDVDFASETEAFNKNKLLSQAGTFALSQANAVQQNVLKLLQ